ncbi:phosphopantetheine-binding protein [Streptomyces sp. NPDC048441]|uniref:phosphopantetheine-binding protein n=1 Tax=Streptomyces sp. NPDC048441 TaxID=3365552 RepID=UPI0037156E7F
MATHGMAAPDGDDGILEILRRCVVRVVPEIEDEEVTGERTMAELGCNSIDRAEILTMAMSELDVTVPVSQFKEGSALATVAATLRRHHD